LPLHLRQQPVAVLAQEALAGRSLARPAAESACAPLVHAQLEPARARIAHAQHVDFDGIVQAQAHCSRSMWRAAG
jgi:hypothetical protein